MIITGHEKLERRIGWQFIRLSISVYLVICVMTSEGSQEKLCMTVSKIDCDDQYTEEGDESICGTDGRTYSNRYWIRLANVVKYFVYHSKESWNGKY